MNVTPHITHISVTSTSLADTKRVAQEVLAVLKKQASHCAANTSTEEIAGAMIVGLRGDLGAGKTTFSQSVAEALGVTEVVTSPTFVIEKIYSTTDDVFKQFVHIDAYRLEGGKELSALDFERVIRDPQNLVFIEWPEQIADALSQIQNVFMISFEFLDEQTRKISYEDFIN